MQVTLCVSGFERSSQNALSCPTPRCSAALERPLSMRRWVEGESVPRIPSAAQPSKVSSNPMWRQHGDEQLPLSKEDFVSRLRRHVADGPSPAMPCVQLQDLEGL